MIALLKLLHLSEMYLTREFFSLSLVKPYESDIEYQ